MTWRDVLKSTAYRTLRDADVVRVYVRMMAAHESGRGVHLSSDEVDALVLLDHAVFAAAECIRDEAEHGAEAPHP